MSDDDIVVKRPRFAAIETTDTGEKVVKIDLKRLGWLSLGLFALGVIVGVLVM